MKTKLLLIFLLLTSYCLLSTGQVPQGFNYQAIARNGEDPVTSPIDVKITIKSASDGGTIFWIEEHLAVQPNTSGLFSLVIGEGDELPGGVAASFSDIDWNITPKFIRTDIDYGEDYVEMGTSQLWAVPYSMVSGNVNDTLKKLVVKEDPDADTTALFEVRNKTGQIIFAVYNAGVRVYVDDGAKGKKGGFAIGGFGSAKSTSQEYFIVSRDSIRAYLDTLSSKGKKGGFAIGGFGHLNKGPGEEYLRVTRDSTRVSIINDPSKGKKGGFAIGGFGAAKGFDTDFLHVTPDSTRVFVNEPGSVETNNGFAVRGRDPATSETGDYMNLGKYTSKIISKTSFLESQEYTSWNLIVPLAKANDTIKLLKASYANLLMTIPYGAGAKGEGAKFEVNTVVTAKALAAKVLSVGLRNIGLGDGSGSEFNGSNNIYIGNVEDQRPIWDRESVVLGYYINNGDEMFPSFNNVLIGYGMKITGNKNVCLGYNAGNSRSNGESNKLYIENSDANQTGALIYGEFDSDKLRLNARVTVRDALQLQPRTAPPLDPLEGEMYFDSDVHKLYVYDGTLWQSCW